MSADEVRWNRSRQIFDALFERFSAKVQWHGSQIVLEFGVGKWGFAGFYREKFEKVLGVDIEDYSERHPGVEFVIYDGIGPTEVTDNSVDIVVSHSVLEHVRDVDQALAEMNRIVKVGGWLYLTVSPLYHSSWGSHIYADGSRVDNWEHLAESSPFYMTDNPLPDAKTSGHFLNKLTSSRFLAAVGRQPWSIEEYRVAFETKAIPAAINRRKFRVLDLMAKGFSFIGRKGMDLSRA